jgi:hypothetical protein
MRFRTKGTTTDVNRWRAYLEKDFGNLAAGWGTWEGDGVERGWKRCGKG